MARAHPVWTRTARARGGGVERGDANRVGDELGLYVQDLLAGADLAQGQPGGDGPVGFLGGVQVCFRGAQAGGEPVVVGVADQYRLTLWRGHRVEQGCVGRGQGPVVAALAARTFVCAFFLAGLGTIRVGSSSVVA